MTKIYTDDAEIEALSSTIIAVISALAGDRPAQMEYMANTIRSLKSPVLLREALKPFKDAAYNYDGEPEKHIIDEEGMLTVAQLRGARLAYLGGEA